MKIANAFACAALVSIPVLALALPSPDGLIQTPPGWTPMTPTRHAESAREWHRGNHILGIDVGKSSGTLRSVVDTVFVPAANFRPARIVSSAPTTLCRGKQGWRIVSTMPAGPDQRMVIEEIVAVDDRTSYVASYARPSSDRPRADAERAIRSLCLKGT